MRNLGAKVLYIINDWSAYAAHPSEIFSISTLQAGGVFSGGLIGALLAAVWYIRKHHLPALATCDAFAPGLASDTPSAASDASPPAAAGANPPTPGGV